MRFSGWVGAVVVAAVAFPITGVAQKFQQPTSEELRMTADPKAPGAPAVFLYREEVTDNANHFQSSYARIKVLTEKGKEWGTVEVPYEPGFEALPIIEARTIHADGTVVPLVGKASDLLVFKAHGNHLRIAVFNLPGIEVGSILEYKWTKSLARMNRTQAEPSNFINAELAASSPEWDVQQQIFVHKAHFYFNSSNNLGDTFAGNLDSGKRARWSSIWSSGFLLYKERLPLGAHVIPSINKSYTLDVADVEPFPEEENSIPLDSMRYRVWFYLTPFTDTVSFWKNEKIRWQKELKEFAVQSPTIKSASNQIVSDAETPEAKARKIYDAVQALDNYDFSQASTPSNRQHAGNRQEPRNVEDVWNEKGGSGNDLAALYLALAKAAGLNPIAMQVSDRDQRIFDPNYLSLQQLNSVLVVLRLNGNDVFLDPGEKLCPFGQLHWTHTLAGGLREDSETPVYSPANSANTALTARRAEVFIDSQGKVAGQASFLFTGPKALYWRQLNLAVDEAEVRKQFSNALNAMLPQGIVGDVERFDGLKSTESNLSAIVKLTGLLGTKTGKRLILPGSFFLLYHSRNFLPRRVERHPSICITQNRRLTT